MPTLGQLIETLKELPQDKIAADGIGRPHSYRGYYDELAFEPVQNVSVADMLAAAKDALGATYRGYKGGTYKMGEWTPVWLAHYGECGEQLCLRCIKRDIIGEVPRG